MWISADSQAQMEGREAPGTAGCDPRARVARLSLGDRCRCETYLLSALTTSPLRIVAISAFDESLNNSWSSFEKGLL